MDSLLAELLGMGFEMDQIERCKEALNLSSSSSFNLQTATEWLLDSANQASGSVTKEKLVLKPPNTSGGNQPSKIEKPMSSSRDFDVSAVSDPLVSRYNYGPSQREDKKKFEAKQREETVRKAKEQRMEKLKSQDLVRRQVEEDRRTMEDKRSSSTGVPPNLATPTNNLTTPTNNNLTTPTEGPSDQLPSSSTCRVQVKLPGGGVLRKVFSSSDTLNDVIMLVAEKKSVVPSSVTIAQAYPRREFSREEANNSLQVLGLVPSASLIATINKLKSASSDSPKPRPVDVSEQMEVKGSRDSPENEPMERSDSDSSEEDYEEDVIGLPQVHGRGPFDNRVGGARGAVPGGVPLGGLPAGRRGMRRGHRFPATFGGEGHRLGGREGTQRAANKVEAAAVHRRSLSGSQVIVQSSRSLAHQLPTMSVLCMRVLVAHSSYYGMPSCAQISPLLAQRLLAALKKDKKLNSKTLAAFYGCPLHVINLDSYSLTTNELLGNVRHFSHLTELSLASCTPITDKAMINTLPYLQSLRTVNLNGCSQLSQDMFRTLRGCKCLEVVKLSGVKMSDSGLGLLLYYSLCSLRELDLSHTDITDKALEHMPKGAPILNTLNVEGTGVCAYRPLPRLPCLRTLSLSLCPVPPDMSVVKSLGECTSLENLSLSGMKMPGSWLQALRGLKLRTLRLPDRSVLFDDDMAVVCGFPLTSLDLSDYLNITDRGISQVSSMRHLISLSLARTKLTDDGMPYLRDLQSLRQLSLDNTMVTDHGLQYISGLRNLEDLSMADTRVTSKLILSGALNKLESLNKLNLTRTQVSDEGLLALSHPCLVALNLDWTCVTDAITKELLISKGCVVLETLRNRNINQPLPEEVEEMEDVQQPLMRFGEEVLQRMGEEGDGDDYYDDEEEEEENME